MAALGRSALRATRTLRASGINSGSESHASAAVRSADNKRLQKTARRDPELYVHVPPAAKQAFQLTDNSCRADSWRHHDRRLRHGRILLCEQADLVLVRSDCCNEDGQRAVAKRHQWEVPVPPWRRREQAGQGCTLSTTLGHSAECEPPSGTFWKGTRYRVCMWLTGIVALARPLQQVRQGGV